MKESHGIFMAIVQELYQDSFLFPGAYTWSNQQIYFYFSIYFFFFPNWFPRGGLFKFARAHIMPYPEVIENFMPVLLLVAEGFCELF